MQKNISLWTGEGEVSPKSIHLQWIFVYHFPLLFEAYLYIIHHDMRDCWRGTQTKAHKFKPYSSMTVCCVLEGIGVYLFHENGVLDHGSYIGILCFSCIATLSTSLCEEDRTYNHGIMLLLFFDKGRPP